ncbi:hypothetical protein [Paenibacillus sp. FJAT-27812]|uniref:hypothetical protein n=1 Tax=Paenibacillus sp. FJAT-27812 TaxID=1684143 RepID=UPI0006A75F5B|nr:hypothetical protein [Paenibacillus sp. FJAT-27812]
MRNMMIIGCLIGSIFAFNSDYGKVTNTYSLSTSASKVMAEASAKAADEMVSASMPPSTVTEVTYASNDASAANEATQSFALQTVNGITLYDDPSSVTKKLGEPKRISEDPHLKELKIYEYPNMNVVFSDGMVNFVEITEGSKSFLIDGVEIPATIEAVKEALGEPDYFTEDGIAFERNEAVLKLFVDTDTQKLTSIHYFYSFTM